MTFHYSSRVMRRKGTGTRVLLYPKLNIEYQKVLRVHNRALIFELTSQRTQKCLQSKAIYFENLDQWMREIIIWTTPLAIKSMSLSPHSHSKSFILFFFAKGASSFERGIYCSLSGVELPWFPVHVCWLSFCHLHKISGKWFTNHGWNHLILSYWYLTM